MDKKINWIKRKTKILNFTYFNSYFKFPHELVTYGGNGHVFSNWAQVRITKNIDFKVI